MSGVQVVIVAGPPWQSAAVRLETALGLLAMSPARRLPDAAGGVPPEDRDALLRTAARDFAAACGYRVAGEFTPAGLAPAQQARGMTGWQAPAERAPDPDAQEA